MLKFVKFCNLGLVFTKIVIFYRINLQKFVNLVNNLEISVNLDYILESYKSVTRGIFRSEYWSARPFKKI